MSYGVACPHCGVTLAMTTQTRQHKGGVRRTRTCTGCGESFVTREVSAADWADPAHLRLLMRRLNTADRAIHGGFDNLEDTE